MSLNPKHFTNVPILKQIDFKLLLRFLKPYRDYLENKRKMPWSEDEKSFHFKRLSLILMIPDTDAPQEMLDALFFVEKMASEKTFDLLQDKAEEAGVRVPQDIDPASLALLVRLEAPELLEEIHAETLLTKPKRFVTFDCASRGA